MKRFAASNLSIYFRVKNVLGFPSSGVFFLLFLILPQFSLAQTAPAIQWQQSFGGPRADEGFSIIQTANGGYTVGGYTNGGPDDYIRDFHGYEDGWVINLNSIGQQQWNECYGGSLDEEINAIVQTPDGGYCCAMRTESDDGEVMNSNGGPSDAWIVKLDPTGNIEWQDDLGGSNFNDPLSLIQTSDGGFVFAGYTLSTDGDVTGHHGASQNADAWVVKLNSAGKMSWGKCFGGSERDWAESVVQTADGGFCFAGLTNSTDGDVTGFHGGGSDVWIVKLDTAGNIQWQKCFGGDSDDYATSIAKDSDGGFAVAGFTYSNDGDVSGNHGGSDMWVFKLDSAGGLVWQKCLGGSGSELARSIARTTDAGFVVAGSATSNDGDVSGNHGGTDAWIVKLDRLGTIQWQKCFGGSDEDKAYNIIQTNDLQYIFTGSTDSKDGDVTQYFGAQDAWVVKLGDPISSVSAAPATTAQCGLSLTAQISLNSAIIGFFVPNWPADVRIEVTNILGMQIEEIDEKALETGCQNVTLDLSRFVAGTYVIEISACGQTQTIPFSLAK